MLKKLLSMVLGAIVVMGMGTTAFAAESIPTEGRVIQIAIPNENGVMQVYTGEQAQMIYNQLQNTQPETNIQRETTVTELNSDTLKTQRAFSDKYRFVTTKKSTKWGKAERITPYAANTTSVQQSQRLLASTSKSWSINVSLSGKFKEAFEGAVGGGWQQTSTMAEEFTINVAPKKRVWLEFQPKLQTIEGESQKYFIPRGPASPFKQEVIEERKSVYSESPTTVTMKISNKSVKCPDGAYIWKEDSNYNNK